jgi:hypothetical protein
MEIDQDFLDSISYQATGRRGRGDGDLQYDVGFNKSSLLHDVPDDLRRYVLLCEGGGSTTT